MSDERDGLPWRDAPTEAAFLMDDGTRAMDTVVIFRAMCTIGLAESRVGPTGEVQYRMNARGARLSREQPERLEKMILDAVRNEGHEA